MGQDSITVHVWESILNCEITKDIVDNLSIEYSQCSNILVSASWIKVSNDEREKIAKFIVDSTNYKDIQLIFI